MRWVALIICGAVTTLPSFSFADCMACTVSKGVLVTLKDNTVVNGYIAWNGFEYADLMGLHDGGKIHQSVTPYVKKQGWLREDALEESEVFSRWTALLNYLIREKKVSQSPVRNKTIEIYKSLMEIKYPFSHYVGIQGKVLDISIERIAAISVNRDLPLSVGTTGLDVLPLKDIVKLQTRVPRYTLEHEHCSGVFADIYVCYGNQVPLSRLLDHILYTYREMPEGIETIKDGLQINDVYIEDIATSVQRSTGPTTSENPKVIKKTCVDFLRKVEELADGLKNKVAGCKSQRECAAERRVLFDKFGKSLGSKDALHDLGIISFSYSWD